MSQGPLPPILPDDQAPGEHGAPTRPEEPSASRSPLFAAFVLSFVLAIVFGVLAVGKLLQEPSRVVSLPSTSPLPIASPSPSPTLAPRTVEGHYRFLHLAAGGAPVRWNPCEPITYAINRTGIARDIHPDLHEALRRVTAATGIRFRPVGSTRETFISAYIRMRYRGVFRGAALILIWVDHQEYEAIKVRLGDTRPTIAFAKTMSGLYADRDQYFGGIVVVDADATSAPGFGWRYAHGSVLLHELGHIIGLGHVRDPRELLYSGPHPDPSVRTYAAGDREGLRLLGRQAGCLD